MIPGQKMEKNFFLLAASIGIRSVRKEMSSSFGSGMQLNIQMPIIKMGINTNAVQKGIHCSLSENCWIKIRPIDFTMPEAIIKELAINAPSISVNFRPSKKLNTIPQINPKGKPLTNINTAL